MPRIFGTESNLFAMGAPDDGFYQRGKGFEGGNKQGGTKSRTEEALDQAARSQPACKLPVPGFLIFFFHFKAADLSLQEFVDEQ